MGKNKDSPIDNAPLNEESWNAFICALFPADNKPQDAPVNAKNPNGIRWIPLYDIMASGYRQKFNVLDRSELTNWACDNHKSYDVCKDIKTLVDSSSDIPDALLAKLIRLYLTLAKAEGLEAKNSSKQDGSGSNPSLNEGNKKGGKKEDKKDADREKSASTLKRPAAPAKGKLMEARGDSADNDAEGSKRKQKLRDKVGGKNDKIQSIGDEPEDGPDAYYILRDFDSPGFYNALSEECDIQINTILTLQEGIKLDLEFTANTTTLGLKDYAKKSSDSSNWRNLVWATLPNAETTEPRDLFDKIAYKIYNILNQKRNYSSFYSKDVLINIPEVDSSIYKRYDLRFYDNALNSIKKQNIINEDLQLGIALEQLTRFMILDEELQESEGHGPVFAEEIGVIQNYFGQYIQKLSLPVQNKLNGATLDTVSDGYSPTVVLNYADLESLIIEESKSLLSFGQNPHELFKKLESRFPVKSLQNIVSFLVKYQVGDSVSAQRERVLMQTEFKKFSKLQDRIIQRCLLQFDFEELIQKKFNTSLSLDSWCWSENYDASTLSQILQKAKTTYSQISTQFCPREGSLLVLMMSPGMPGKDSAETVEEFAVKNKVGLGQFNRLIDKETHLLDPKVNGVSLPYCYVAGDRILNYQLKSSYLYPDTGAIIQIKSLETKSDSSKRSVHLTYEDVSLSFAKDAYFTITLNDGTQFSISKSDSNTIQIHLSTVEGLFIDLLPYGKVSQRFTGASPYIKANSRNETGRVILPDATVIRYIEDDLVQVYLPNSHVLTRNKNKQWSGINQEGIKAHADSTSNEKIRLVHELYFDSKKRIIEREDSTYTILESDGTIIMEYGDDTKVTLQPTPDSENFNSYLEEGTSFKIPSSYKGVVEKEGFAKVELGPEKGYNFITLPNGTTLLRGLKTSSRGTENYIFIKSKYVSIEADTFGNVTVNTILNHGEELKTLAEVQWIDGTLHLKDHSGSEYSVDENGNPNVTRVDSTESRAVNLELESGENLKSLVQDKSPLPSPFKGNVPRLFVIREDGTGSEFFRDDQLISYFKRQFKAPNSDILEEKLAKGGLSISVIESLDLVNQKALLYRHLNRYEPIDQVLRSLVNADLEKYNEWKKQQERVTDDYKIIQPNPDKIQVQIPKQQLEYVLGSDKATTEEWIVRKYNLREGRVTTVPSKHIQKKPSHAVLSIFEAAKIHLEKPGSKAQKRTSYRPSIVKESEKLIKHTSEIPKYFDSKEGKEALSNIQREETEKRKKLKSPEYIRDVSLDEEEEEEELEKLNQLEESPSIHLEPELLVTDLSVVEAPALDLMAPLPNSNVLDSSVPVQPQEQSQTAVEQVTLVKNKTHVGEAIKEKSHTIDPLKTNVFGNPRQDKVPLPSFTKLSKPGAIPNQQFLKVEAPTRRTSKTASTAPITAKDSSYSLGTFEVLPSHCRFGILKKGSIYSTQITMLNSGIDSTRFRIQKPGSSLLSVYYKKGPVAPGMTIQIEVRLDTEQIQDQILKISDEIVVVTETEYLHIPVTAEIRLENFIGEHKLKSHVRVIENQSVHARYFVEDK